MARIPINLKGFKHVKSDDSTTELEHPAGHRIILAHKALAPENQEQLKALSKIPQQAEQPVDKNMADGGDVAQQEPDSATEVIPDKGWGKIIRVGIADGGKVQGPNNPKLAESKKTPPKAHYADPQDAVSQDDIAQEVTPQYNTPTEMSNDAPQPPPVSEEQAEPSAYAAAKGYDIDNPQPAKDDALKKVADFVTRPFSDFNALQNPQASQPQQADMASASTPDAANAPQDQTSQSPAAAPEAQPQTSTEKFATDKQQIHSDMNNEAQLFQHDLNAGHIKPETYGDLFAKQSTLGKIGSFFGLLTSGMGSGLAHQSNAVLDAMNKEIQNDLEAQQNSVTNKQNFLKINQQGLLNQAQARNLNAESQAKLYALSKIQMNQTALHKLTQEVASMPVGSPQRQQAEQTLAMVNQSVQNDNYNIMDRAATAGAYYRMLFGQGGTGGQQDSEAAFQQKLNGMRMLGPDGEKRANDIASRHIPGFGDQLANSPIKDADRDAIVAHQTVNTLLNEAQEISKLPIAQKLDPRVRARAATIMNELQSNVRTAEDQGVYKKSDAEFLRDTIGPNPTSFMSYLTSAPRLQELQNIQNRGYQNIGSKYGLKFPGLPQNNQGTRQSTSVNSNTIERLDPKSGRTVIYDAATKQPIRWK